MKRRIYDFGMMFLVCCFSLGLLVYVVEGKAGRTYENLYRDAGLAQGELVQNAVDTFVRGDMPLRQFAGFTALVDPLLAADSAIGAIAILDERGEQVFASGAQDATAASPQAVQGAAPGTKTTDQIVLPLRGKFETVGSVVITPRPGAVSARVAHAFRPLWFAVLIASVAFALLVSSPRIVRRPDRFWAAWAFAGTFLGVAALLTVTLVELYGDGATAKGKALLTSLSGRMDDITAYGLNFDQFDGIDRVFAEYRRLNSDISAIGLIIEGVAKFHTDPSQVGHPWQPGSSNHDYMIDISTSANAQSVQVAMALPKNVVYRQVADNVRNIVALFVASGFFAFFFMNLARTLQSAQGTPRAARAEYPGLALGLVKPVFFLATFVENLNYAFLPQYVQAAAQAAGLSRSYVSVPFIAYYLCFAVALIPAGRAEGKCGPHRLIWTGLIAAAAGLTLLVGELGFASLVAARALSGAGQGVLFIGVQSYILRNTTSDARTKGGSIIVVGFQAGMISGMAIGSLLAAQLGAFRVFEIGAITAALAAFYAWSVIPKVAIGARDVNADRNGAWRNVAATLGDLRFLRTIGLIGLPAKAVLTGVVLFALPLVLTGQGFGQEEIGQITMIYAATVIAASSWVSGRADRPGGTGGLLVLGAILSGVGLLMIAGLGWTSKSLDIAQLLPVTPLVILGVMTVGFAHGLINAPVVTHVTESRISARLGSGSVAATYRLLERLGHTAGPALVGQIIAHAGSGFSALGWIGGVVVVMGILFAMTDLGKADEFEPEIA